MGKYSRQGKLKCSKCYEKYSRSDQGRKWNWVEAVKQVGEQVFCICQRCGHEYLSNSKAARNRIERAGRFQNIGGASNPILISMPEPSAEAGISKVHTFNVDDIRRISADGNTITEIKKKRRGTYGHRSKDGARFFGRETIVWNYER